MAKIIINVDRTEGVSIESSGNCTNGDVFVATLAMLIEMAEDLHEMRKEAGENTSKSSAFAQVMHRMVEAYEHMITSKE